MLPGLLHEAIFLVKFGKRLESEGCLLLQRSARDCAGGPLDKILPVIAVGRPGMIEAS